MKYILIALLALTANLSAQSFDFSCQNNPPVIANLVIRTTVATSTRMIFGQPSIVVIDRYVVAITFDVIDEDTNDANIQAAYRNVFTIDDDDNDWEVLIKRNRNSYYIPRSSFPHNLTYNIEAGFFDWDLQAWDGESFSEIVTVSITEEDFNL